MSVVLGDTWRALVAVLAGPGGSVGELVLALVRWRQAAGLAVRSHLAASGLGKSVKASPRHGAAEVVGTNQQLRQVPVGHRSSTRGVEIEALGEVFQALSGVDAL